MTVAYDNMFMSAVWRPGGGGPATFRRRRLRTAFAKVG